MTTLGELKIIEIKREDLPLNYRDIPAVDFKTFVKTGNAKKGYQEKKCENMICKVCCPKDLQENILVTAQDGFMYDIWLENFDTVEIIKVNTF